MESPVRDVATERAAAPAKWLFPVQWILVTGAAVFLANLVLEVLFFRVLGYAFFFIYPAAGVIGGAPIAIGQWLVLRPHFARAHTWVLATCLGFVGAWVVGLMLLVGLVRAITGGGAYVSQLAFGAATLSIGLAQWPVVRRWTSHTAWWVIASTIGWAGMVVLMHQKWLDPINQPGAALLSWI